MNAIQNYVWGLSKQLQYADNETVIQITTTQPNQTFEWYSVTGPVQYYDWNGVQTNSKSHTFANAGVYTIKIVGDISSFRINRNGHIDHLVTKIIHVASTINNFSWCFYSCRNLTSIPQRLFDKNVSVTDFWGCFNSCTGLTSIPYGLFDKNVNAINFEWSFHNCTNLNIIPQGLFDKNVNVTKFDFCFSSCTNLSTIPQGLFDKNVNATNFQSCFLGSISLKNRPKPHGLEMWQIAGTNGRPSNVNVQTMFRQCTAMSDYNSLPANVR